ncbi:MAG: hypothetical protein ACYTDY_09435 [Planctomycetota bacterium]|jgi:hypothetical protein
MTAHDLADRLTRLERENRRLKRIGGVVLLGIVAVVAMGQAKRPEVHEVLAAKQFILKDGDGNDRAMLYLQAEAAVLGLFDGEERAVVSLNAGKDGAAVATFGYGLTNPFSVSIHRSEDFAGVVVSGMKKQQAELFARKRPYPGEKNRGGAVALILWDEDGKTSFKAPK